MGLTRLLCRTATLAVLVVMLTACLSRKERPPSGETFSAGDTYSRTYPVAPAAACEAARRALLGQGYLIGKKTADTFEATKSFQPKSDVHTQLNVRTTCLSQPRGGAIVFVNALQDRYELNTTVKSASIGVSMIGSVSLPIGSSSANLVRVASNTVQNREFYRRLFEQVGHYVSSAEDLPASRAPELPVDPVL
ncbi:DUF2242 domain-containing protein [Cognatilysobacter bugurensis]|uniref:DUF2242 domain-containing protein n=1 Tax=Cognatilysobacter bugurensis TaxID=543356 RepID=A0A918SYU7_9GAMM|nr:DUF2242 domain-containing protein [Lysobacter bugurensis]GHA78849.1 hypothetical protein GCM10007067_15330 [Lysobacter bugurensis]